MKHCEKANFISLLKDFSPHSAGGKGGKGEQTQPNDQSSIPSF